ncbi:UNVERIFIED_CONTAM: hypothetical protein Sradi_1315800 [Sesamum radiatum]|uniref:Uncharacterized protein n=1 Tax=Sesamum radiatum TaxID=300843 RepID=A0AAW2UQB4_SESRA
MTLFLVNTAPTYLDKVPHGQGYDGGSKLDPGASASYSRFLPSHHPSGPGRPDMHGPGHEFDQHHMKHFARRSPNREYVGSSPHGFGGPSSYARVTSALMILIPGVCIDMVKDRGLTVFLLIQLGILFMMAGSPQCLVPTKR